MAYLVHALLNAEDL
ncbi:hypothetical protein [Massilia sp. DWR3-1-1]